MKKITLLLLFITTLTFAQIPSGYYNSATGSGYTLKTQLYNIIKNHSDQGYGALWDLYTETPFRDNYYETNGSLLDMYSENPDGSDAYEYTNTTQQCGNVGPEGTCYNREHLVPQAYFDNYAVNPMKNDAFHVIATDSKVNGWRDNLPFGRLSATTLSPCNSGATNKPCYTTNGSKLGFNNNFGYSAGFSGNVFEPIDEFKGDIARALFYFATRYEPDMDNFYTTTTVSDTDSKAMFDGSTNKVFSDTFLNILITWHLNDEVSPREIAINNAIYNFQGNRNPYIDHPEYICMIYSTQCANLSAQNFASLQQVSIYPNPATNNEIFINTPALLNNIKIISINGQILKDIENPIMFDDYTYKVENLSSGFYLLILSSNNESVVKKIIVQ